MKHLLLGTTALVAAGLMVGEAYAADGVKLGIGGRYLGAAGGIIDEDDSTGESGDDRHDDVVKQDIEVYFTGETTLDNGLTVGARIELEGQNQDDDQVDATFAYLSGGFGEFRLGDTLEALGQMCYLVPTASAMFGADSPNFNFSNSGVNGDSATNGTCYGIDDKSTKLAYFSPNFAGFSFGLSYTPDNTEDQRNLNAGGGTGLDEDTGQNSNNVSVAGNFTQDFNGFNVYLGGAYSFANREEPDNSNRSEINGYVGVGFGGWTVGGAYSLRDDVTTNGEDQQVYGVGVTYNWEAWTVGLGYSHGDYETDADANEDEMDIFALTGSYALGPGIQIDGVVEYTDYNEDGNSDDADYNGIGVGLGLGIQF
jgi:predicted porin